ncbi:MAG: ISNCY family transposase, partial [Dehalococcoidia bacterium]|nr:ISNCY family transposase [Dehalococcoidia bacterium]
MKEQTRLGVLNEVEGGRLRMGMAAEVVGLSMRQVRRLRAAYRKEGAAGLAHRNRGRRPHNALDAGIAQRVVALAKARYLGVNQQHLTELLDEGEEIHLSRSTVRRVLLRAGIGSPRKRRAPEHRSRRERKPREGIMLQVDGSPHDWLEGRGPHLCLVGAIDDATSHVPYALFREQEDSQGYLVMLRRIVETKGIPLSLYHDRHSIFVVSRKHVESIEEQLAGKRALTQFGRALEELGIGSIKADSAEAKGRIERLWRTFQDRLVSELRLAHATTLTEANEVLRRFLLRYNRRFVVPAAESERAYRPVDEGLDLDTVFCFKYRRTVGRDNVVRFGGHRIQVLPSHGRISYARAKVEVHEHMDGSIAVYYGDTCLATTVAPFEAPLLRARKSSRPPGNATPDLPASSPPTAPAKPRVHCTTAENKP